MLLQEEYRLQSLLVAEVVGIPISSFTRTVADRMRRKKRTEVVLDVCDRDSEAIA